MDTRKLIAFGTNTHVVSLPKKWLEENNLKKGDIIQIASLDNDLVISGSSKKIYTKDIKINVEGKKIEILTTEIVTAYLQGYNNVTLEGPSLNKITKDIRLIISKLPGLEIMHLTTDVMKVKNLLNEKNVSINEIVMRTHYMIKSMIDDSIKCFEEDLYDAIIDRDNDVNRMVFLAFRVLRKASEDRKLALELNLSPVKIMVKWQVVMRLEKVGDQSKRIARNLRLMKVTKNQAKEIKSIYLKLKDRYNNLMDNFENPNKKILLEIATETKVETRLFCNEILQKSNDLTLVKMSEHFKNMGASIEHIAQSLLTNP